MAEIVRRRSWGGVLPLGRHASIRGSKLIHCASTSMAPLHLGEAKRSQSEPVQARTGPSGRRLEAIVRGLNSAQKDAARAKVILATADGCGTMEIARRSGLSKPANST